MRKLLLGVLLLVSSLFLMSCGDERGRYVEIERTVSQMVVGVSYIIEVDWSFGGSSEDDYDTVSWSSSNTSIATIIPVSSDEARVTPVAAGEFIVTATVRSADTSEEISDTASFTVREPNAALSAADISQ